MKLGNLVLFVLLYSQNRSLRRPCKFMNVEQGNETSMHGLEHRDHPIVQDTSASLQH